MTFRCLHQQWIGSEAAPRQISSLDTTEFGVLVCSPESTTFLIATFMSIWGFPMRVISCQIGIMSHPVIFSDAYPVPDDLLSKKLGQLGIKIAGPIRSITVP